MAILNHLPKKTVDTVDFALKNDPIFINSISMGRKQDSTVGSKSVATGDNVTASGGSSHAEGLRTIASAYQSHAEGEETTASGGSSHAEGYKTVASEDYAHAEGQETTASGGYAHAEGYQTIASGYQSHAEGFGTIAQTGTQTVIGAYNVVSLGNRYVTIHTNPAFIIGNGSSDENRSNAFRATFDSHVYTGEGGSYNSSGADYGEFFEWLDGNELAEDRIGYFVTLDGNKIKAANQGDYIIGVVSGVSSIIGNSDEDYRYKFETDVFGRLLYETKQEPIKKMQTRKSENVESIVEEVEIGETVEVEIPIISKTYDKTQPYIERKNRKEWDVVGMMGQLIVRDDGTCQENSYCTVADGGIAVATEDKTGYRVIERVADNIIKIIFR